MESSTSCLNQQFEEAEAHRAWHRCISARRAIKAPRRPIADILIGAFATRFDGILTRNEADFKQVFPTLPITAP